MFAVDGKSDKYSGEFKATSPLSTPRYQRRQLRQPLRRQCREPMNVGDAMGRAMVELLRTSESVQVSVAIANSVSESSMWKSECALIEMHRDGITE